MTRTCDFCDRDELKARLAEAAGLLRDWLRFDHADVPHLVASTRSFLQPTDSAPVVVPAPLNVDGIILADGRAMLVGTATWDRDTKKYRCLANVKGALCVVEIKVTPHAADSASTGEDVSL